MADNSSSNATPPKPSLAASQFFNEAYRKEAEEKNRQRVQLFMKRRKANRITGALCTVGVLSIYAYTMYAVKQEIFLDDFNEPEMVHD